MTKKHYDQIANPLTAYLDERGNLTKSSDRKNELMSWILKEIDNAQNRSAAFGLTALVFAVLATGIIAGNPKTSLVLGFLAAASLATAVTSFLTACKLSRYADAEESKARKAERTRMIQRTTTMLS